jgi:hypothetical protein
MTYLSQLDHRAAYRGQILKPMGKNGTIEAELTVEAMSAS